MNESIAPCVQEFLNPQPFCQVKPIKGIKKIKVVILVNTLTSVESTVYSNHIEFFVWHAKNHPEIDFIFYTPHRMSIDSARNSAADYALQLEADYLMFIDDDVLIPRDSLHKLIQNDKDICAGLVIIRGYPFNVMSFKFKKPSKKLSEEFKKTGVNRIGFYNDLPKRNGKLQKLVKCDAVGFSLCLIKIAVLKKISQPFFITGSRNTEDVYFCIKAKEELGKENVSIYTDTSLECGHLLDKVPVCWTNRKALQEYQEKVEPKRKPKAGRAGHYFSRNLKNLK